MDFVDFLRYLMRQRWVALIGLVLSVGGAVAAYVATPVTYVASSQAMVLLPPTAGSTEDTGPISPFLYQPSGLLILARIVTVIPNSPDFRDVMQQDGYEASYTVEIQTGTPLVTFSVEGDTSEDVLATRDELMRRFESELSRIQTEQDVPRRQFADVRILEASTDATPASGNRLRSAALAGVAGVMLTLAVIMILNGRGSRTRKEPSKSTSKAPSESPTKAPSRAPSKSASKAPSRAPSKAPSKAPPESRPEAPAEAAPPVTQNVNRTSAVPPKAKARPTGKTGQKTRGGRPRR